MKEAPDAPRRGLGKWGEAGVPHKGWEWIGSDDLGEDRRICEMCDSVEIRYVHFARHDDYPDTLAVGCICIENMTEDYAGPRRREKGLRNRAKRRRNFPDRKQWKISRNGNPHIDLDGYRIVIVRRGHQWGVNVKPPGDASWTQGRNRYPNERAAKLGAFDGVMRFIDRRTRNTGE